MNDLRTASADAAFQAFDFAGSVIADMGGWEYSAPGVEYSRAVYFENTEDRDGDTVKGHFTVVFESTESAVVRESYAMINGQLIGVLASLEPVAHQP